MFLPSLVGSQWKQHVELEHAHVQVANRRLGLCKLMLLPMLSIGLLTATDAFDARSDAAKLSSPKASQGGSISATRLAHFPHKIGLAEFPFQRCR